MQLEALVTAGGTAGLIGYLLYTVVKFGSNEWQSRSAVDARFAEKDAAHARELALVTGERDRALEAGKVLVPAVEALTDELERSRRRRRGEDA
jgi:hypothetical protein